MYFCTPFELKESWKYISLVEDHIIVIVLRSDEKVIIHQKSQITSANFFGKNAPKSCTFLIHLPFQMTYLACL